MLAGGFAVTGGSRATAQTLPDTGGRPIVFFRTNGEATSDVAPISASPGTSPPFRSGQPLQFRASAFDSDGLGFPIFAFAGIDTPISFLWDFGGGQANPLAIFAESPVVTFDLDPGQESATFAVTLTAFDRTGLSATATGAIAITRTGPPVVNLIVEGLTLPALDGFPVPLRGQNADGVVRFGSLAFDESGLGFPIFAALGNTSPVSYVWSFGGGQPANELEIFSPNPTVTFPTGPAETTFRVSLTVFDATGQSSTRAVNLSLTRGSLPPGPPRRF